MMEAVGIGLAVTSLALQLLGGCIQCYEVFLAVTEMPAQYEYLRIRLSLEQSRLLKWGERAGFLEEVLEQPSQVLRLHRNIIVDILYEIQRLFKDCLRIQSRVESTKAYGEVKPNRLAQLTVKLSHKDALFAKAIRAWETTAGFPTRLQWALIKQEKFTDLVGKLISYNDSIVSLLDRTTIQQIHDSQVTSQLTLLQLTSKVDDLHKLVLASQIRTIVNIGTSAGLTTGVTREGGNDFARLASFKAQQLTLEADTTTNAARLIERNEVQILEEISTRSLAIYKDTPTWVEWKEYDSDSHLSDQEITEARVKKLANLLSIRDTPREFRSPKCLGYIHDTNEATPRYGLVYNIGIGMPEARPIALLDLIKKTRKSSLTNRMELAYTIASSLLYLHSVNWLHKGIRSENILFLLSPNESAWEKALVISGFEYARPDLPEEQTEKPADNFQHDLYRHPNALGRSDIRSKKSWDLYSLGIVLIELAMWTPIGDLLGLTEHQKNARSQLRKVRSMVLGEEFLSRIGAEAGDRYEDAVRRCIRGDDCIGIAPDADESDIEVGAEMQRAVSEFIVGQLRGIQV